MRLSDIINSTYIPANYYLSKSQVAELLNISTSTLQWHIGRGNIETIHFPGLGHLISEWSAIEFEEKLDEIRPGRPSIYKKAEK